jgi:hypothetical protein
MAVVNPIIPNTKPTAALMNAVWGEFDRKLTKILSGKSFLLARKQPFLANLMGKIFYFNDNPAETVYSLRAQGFIAGGGLGPDGQPNGPPLPIPYDHEVFTRAIASIEAKIAADPTSVQWDDANRIVTVPTFMPIPPNNPYAFTNPDYGQLPFENGGGMGLFDHSLAAHTIMHQGPKDNEPVPYFVREWGAVPEKRYRFALAEIVVEGLTDLDIPDEYDKYNCFRIHNLSEDPLTVTFGSNYSIDIDPFGCACVRRDSVTEKYRDGFTYFFKFEKGDPRFAWFHATQKDMNLATVIGGSPMMRVSNSMQANNLMNPLSLHDWIGFVSFTASQLAYYTWTGGGTTWGQIDLGGTGDTRYAWFERDPSTVADVHLANKDFFGDPNDPNTLVGDLLFHPGKIIVARTSRTDKDEQGFLKTTFSTIDYRGMATIVEDFAAGGVTVYTETDTSLPSYGQLCFKNALSDICELIPVSTNLFKRWDEGANEEVHTPMVPLHDAGFQNLPVPGYIPGPSLDYYFFEKQPPHGVQTSVSGFALGPDTDQTVFQRNLRVQDDSRTWYDLVYSPARDDWDVVPRTVNVPDAIKRITVPNPTSWRKTLHFGPSTPAWCYKALHQMKVADLLDLSWWGDPQLADQATPYVTFANKKLTLSDQGLVLTFDETISAYMPEGADGSLTNNGMALCGDIYQWKVGQLTRKRVITFRGHGWGHTGQGSKSMGFASPRRGKQVLSPYVDYEVSGPNGIDFKLPNRGASQTAHRMLQRFKYGEMVLPDHTVGRFWRACGRDVDVFLKNYNKPHWYGAFKWVGYDEDPTVGDTTKPQVLDYWGNCVNMKALTDGEMFALPLLVEHYNGMAAAVNSLTKGYGLTCACLQWRVDGRLLSLIPGTGIYFGGLPEPMGSFASFRNCEDMFVLANHLGLKVHGMNDRGDEESLSLPQAEEMPQNLAVMFTGQISGSVTGATANVYTGDPNTYPGQQLASLGSITLGSTASLTPGAFSPGDLARGIAPAGHAWTPAATAAGASAPPDGHVGDYYICTNSGWVVCNNGSEWNYAWAATPHYCLKGDVLIWNDTLTWQAAGGWSRHSTAHYNPGCAYIPQTNRWVTLTPQVAGPGVNYPEQLSMWAVATNCLGDWHPPTLPATDGVNRGDYYNTKSTDTDMGAFAGGKLIFDGNSWQVCNSDYAGFLWISIGDVQDLMESMGFNMIYNEVVVPLSLDWEVQGLSGQTPGAYTMTRSDTYPMYAQPWGGGGDLLSACAALNTSVTSSASLCTGPVGARWQFTTTNGGDGDGPDPAWKIRANLYALWDGSGPLADQQNWGLTGSSGDGRPPAFIEEAFVFGGFVDGGMGLAGNGWLIYFPGGNETAWPNLNFSIGRSGGSYSPLNSPDYFVWGGMWVGGNDNLFQCGRTEASGDMFNAAFYQHLAYAVLAANSEGTNPDSSFTLLPQGYFISDGDAMTADDLAFKKLAWGGVMPMRWMAPDASDTAETVEVDSNGLTALECGGGVALLQGGFSLNAISLD